MHGGSTTTICKILEKTTTILEYLEEHHMQLPMLGCGVHSNRA